jgi:YesN/AraC family two-component response regulator
MLPDISMPALFRIQLARKVKEINPSIKVVPMTAFEIRDNEFLKYFVLCILTTFQKPIRIGELANKILSIIGETKMTLDED